MKKKLLLITADFPYGNKGDNMFMQNEFDTLCSTFEHVTVLCTSSEQIMSYKLQENVTVIRKDITKKSVFRLFKSALSVLSLKGLKELKFARKAFNCSYKEILTGIARYNYAYYTLKKSILTSIDKDTIIYNYWLSSRAYAVAKLKSKNKIKCKTVSRCHGFDCYVDRGYLPFRNEIVSNTDEIYFISEDGRNSFKKDILLYCKNKFAKLRVSKLGLSLSGKFVDNGKLETLRIVSCSRIVPVKRLDRLIDALCMVHTNIEWTHIGDGQKEYEDSIKNYAFEKLERHKNIRFKFVGRLSSAEIYKMYSEGQFDLFVNTSESEGIPVSIMEAYAFSLPALGLNVGGMREIIADEEFLLPESASPADIALALENIGNIGYDDYSAIKKKVNNYYQNNFSKVNYIGFLNDILQESFCIIPASIDQLDYANIDSEKDYGNVCFVPLYRKLKSVFLKALRRIWFKFNLPYKKLWYHPFIVRNTAYQDNIIIFDSILGLDIFKYLQNHSIAKLNFWCWNIVGNRQKQIETIKKYSKVWSFDEDDCTKYGLNFNHQFYGDKYKYSVSLCEKPFVLFIGRNKNRLRLLKALAEYLRQNSIEYKFYILGKFEKIDDDNIIPIKKFMNYETTLQLIHNATCLVDFVQEGQSGMTLRVLEALFNSKKLITNNTSLKNSIPQEYIFTVTNDFVGLADFLVQKPNLKNIGLSGYSFENWLMNFR